MVSRPAVAPSPLTAGSWVRQLESLPGGRAGAIALMIAGGVLAIAAGALPLIPAVVGVIGLPAAALALTKPRVALVLLVFSIPLSTWTTVVAGKFSIASTDIIVAILLLGFLLRGVTGNGIVLYGGPAIGMLTLVFAAALLSTTGVRDFPDALKELIKLAEMVGVAWYASSMLRRREDLRFATLVLLAAGAMEALNGLRQFVTRDGPDFFSLGPFMRAFGDFGQPNALAGYLGMILPFGILLALYPSPGRRIVVAAVAVIGMAIAATWSRGAWFGVAAGLSVMALAWSQQSRRGLAAGSALVALVVIFGVGGLLPPILVERIAVLFENFVVFDVRSVEPNPANWALVERMAHWQAGWSMAMDHPLLGVGPGNYEAAYASYYLGDWVDPLGHAHNYYINTFAETGVVGLIVLLAFLVTLFARLITAIRGATGRNTTGSTSMERIMLVGTLGAAVTVSVHNSFDNMFVHGIGIQFGLILGLAEAAARLARQRDLGALS